MILVLKPLTKTISDNVKRYRKSRKMTQEVAAARANLPFRTYQNAEYGEGYPEEATLMAVAKAFGVSPALLLEEVEDPKTPIKAPETCSSLLGDIIVELGTNVGALDEDQLRGVLNQVRALVEGSRQSKKLVRKDG